LSSVGSPDTVGRILEPIAAAVQPPAVPHRLPALLVDTESDESLIARFLLGYGDRTRAAYLADLRCFHTWCARIGVGLVAAHRGHIEAYIRALEGAGRSRATVARRLATLAGFYRYAVQEGVLPHSPAAHIRRPTVARDSQTLGLDREEAVRFLAAAQATSPRDHALACLLTLNGCGRQGRPTHAGAAGPADRPGNRCGARGPHPGPTAGVQQRRPARPPRRRPDRCPAGPAGRAGQAHHPA
jgi:hypothetical protein